MSGLNAGAYGELAEQFHARNLAAGTGELCLAVRREVSRLISGTTGGPLGVFHAGIHELRQRNLIGSTEAQDLGAICELVLSSEKGDAASRRSERIDALFHRMLVDPNCTPVALAIASAVSKASELGDVRATPDGAIARKISPEQGMIGGALVGAGAGAAAGGVFGAVLGAAVGAVVGCTLGVCDSVSV